MKVRIIFLTVFHCGKKCFILKEISVLYCLGNSCQILVNNAAGTNIHVTNLGISHLAIRQPHCQS